MMIVAREVGQSLRILHPEIGEPLGTVKKIERERVEIEIDAPTPCRFCLAK